MHEYHSVAIPEDIESDLTSHLIRPDGQEDLCFCLWYPSTGQDRFTALLQQPIFPIENDRQIHGNASFNPSYFDRVCKLALKHNAGICFMHSHPVPGWQSMSEDDIVAENKLMAAAYSLTSLPLLGMTIGSDGTWSARFWLHDLNKYYKRVWCDSVRSLGKLLKVHFNDNLISRSKYKEEYKRTISVLGEDNHSSLARVKIGIVGLGSVGSIVAELLSRMGFSNIVLIDFDRIKRHNLDRTLYATRDDIGKLKIDIAKEMIKASSTASNINIRCVPYSIAEESGYQAALDCDILFSCVDRPRPRRILNHIAYAHLIPVIDGGIKARFKHGTFSGVDWQLQTASPQRPCLECLGAYNLSDVATEIEGKLDDPLYMHGLPDDHGLKNNENVIPFSANLASLEVLQLLALISGIANIDDFGVQRFRYNPGIIDQDTNKKCSDECQQPKVTAFGDTHYQLYGACKSAEACRLETANILKTKSKARYSYITYIGIGIIVTIVFLVFKLQL